MSDKKHYEAIKDVHVNLENRNHAIDEYGYGPLNPKEKNDDFWNEKAKLWKTSVEEAKKSRCYNCAAFNQTPKIIKDMGDALGPVGDKIVEKANLGFCEFFYFKCAGDRTCDAWITNGPLKEDAPANATGAAVPGTGDDAQAFPRGEPLKKYKKKTEKEQDAVSDNVALLRRATPMSENTGTFAGSTTFIVPSSVFHEAKMQKKKGKHWRTYIGEEDHWRHIREYARKHPKKAIILQDENTGAMCYARYGKEKNLMEAPLLTHIDKGQKFNYETGKSVRYPGKKIARIDADHDLHYDENDEGGRYMVRHRKTGVVHGTIFGYRRKKSGTFEINATDSTGQGPKMHKVYRKILQSGHAKALVGKSHSEGGQRIWQKLSSERNVSVHGWRRGRPVNLDPRDPEETHVTGREARSDSAARDIYGTSLVASYVKRKTSKED